MRKLDTEIKYENIIRRLISERIIPKLRDIGINVVLLENKDVFDIIICKNMDTPKLYFIEVKHYSGGNEELDLGITKVKVCNRKYY